jgi:hypothetical protein
MSNFLARFYKYMFLGIQEVPERITDINSIEIQRESTEATTTISNEQARIQLINKINWLLMVVCGISFLVIIIYVIFYPGKSIPDIIQNTFSITLGWFGGALGTFFQIDQNRR